MPHRKIPIAGILALALGAAAALVAQQPPDDAEAQQSLLEPGAEDVANALATGPKWVSGYYAGWYWERYPPSAVDMTAMTHFIFGRYAPGAGTLGGTAGQVLPGAGTGHGASVEDALVAKAHSARVKALAMLGGMNDGKGFVASTTAAVRAIFIRNVLDRCVAKNYDGVDVDWEDSLSTDAQRNQLIAFLTELRAAAAARTRYKAPNAPFIITFPGYAVNVNTDLPVPAWKVTVASRVDQYNLMTYGMQYGCCGWQTWLWAALTGEGPTHPTSIASSIKAYVDAGIPRGKLGMGLGLYGRGYGPPVTGPRQTVSGYWGGDDNVYNWADFHAQGLLSSGTYRFDQAAQTGYYTYSPPISYRGHSVSMLTTEDPQSIAAKGAWAKAGNCGGTIVWTINYGYAASLGRNLPMEAVKRAFLEASSLSVNDISLDEGNSGTRSASFTVSLSAASATTVTARYATANGLATAGSDYVATSGTMSFAPGETRKTLAVPLVGDTAIETDETFTLNLSGATNAWISRAVGTGTIRNDDFPSLTIGDVTVTEGNSGTVGAAFLVTLSKASPQTVTVGYATANGTASAGSDYTSAAGTLTFAPGATSRTITVPVAGGTAVEPTETFFVNLSGPVKATIARAQGKGTILDNDVAAAGPVAETVPWAAAAGVTAAPGQLVKTALDGWNGGAVSSKSLVSGNGFVQTTVGETNTYRVFGLGTGNSDLGYADVEFALYLARNGLHVYEKGVYMGVTSAFATGDRLQVAVESGLVKYKRNGIVFYTSKVKPAYPLLVDTALYSQGATLASVVVSGDWRERVAWKSAVGVAVSGNALKKTAADGWNAGAVSTRSLVSGNGSVQATVAETTTYRVFGLGNGNSGLSYADVDFALYLARNGLHVYEKGVYMGVSSAFATGDRLEVAIESGVVKYKRNGVVLYTSKVAPVYPLLVDTAFYSQGATLAEAVIAGKWQ